MLTIKIIVNIKHIKIIRFTVLAGCGAALFIFVTENQGT